MKRILLISSFILCTALLAQAQNTRPIQPGVAAIKLYPNPATSYVTFDLQSGYEKGLTIAVFSFLGKKMIESPASEKTTFQLNDFTRGVYIYHLTNATGKIIETGKFQVTR